MTIVPSGRRSRRGQGHRPHPAAVVDGRVVHHVGCRGTGATADSHAVTRQRACLPVRRSEVSIQDDKAFTCDVRAVAGGARAPRLAGAALAGHHIRAEEDDRWRGSKEAVGEHQRPGHRDRHPSPRRAADGLFHTTQVCIGCKACEVACSSGTTCPRTARSPARASPTTQRGSLRFDLAPCPFVELLEPSPQLREGRSARWRTATEPAAGDPSGWRVDIVEVAQSGPAAWTSAEAVRKMGDWVFHVRRVQALHERGLPGRLSDRRR